MPSERIKKTLPLREFVSQYVELSAIRHWLLSRSMKMPIPASVVNEEEGYWHCFACNKGGSVIDFWMTLNDCDFQTAVRDLAQQMPLKISPCQLDVFHYDL